MGQTHAPNLHEVTFRDVFASMNPDAGLINLRGKLSRKIVFILGVRAVKKMRAHPFFQHQPVSKIDSFDKHILFSLLDRSVFSIAVNIRHSGTAPYPLTAPAIIPLTSLSCRMQNMMIIGSTDNVRHAMIMAVFDEYCP